MLLVGPTPKAEFEVDFLARASASIGTSAAVIFLAWSLWSRFNAFEHKTRFFNFYRQFSLAGVPESARHAFSVVNQVVGSLVTFVEAHLHEVVVLAVGFSPLAVLWCFVFFEFWVTRPVDMTTHPFVRFPWWLIFTVGAAAFVRGDNPVGYVLVAFGSIYFGAHVIHHTRVSRGYCPTPLPWEYGFSEWPAAAALFLCTGLCVGYVLRWIGLCPTLFGFFRAVQAAYGAYFFLCYLFSRVNRQIEEKPAAWNGRAGLAVVGVVGAFKKLNPGARTALMTGTTAGPPRR